MNERSGFDLGRVVTVLVVALALVVIAIRLIPVLFQVVWNVLPGVVIIVLIFWVLRGMVKKLLG